MITEITAIVALVIALISAIYARRSAGSAHQANRIAIHQERLKIYKALLAHVSALSAQGVALRKDEAWQFYEPAILSKFYFKPAHSEKLVQIFDDSISLIVRKAQWEETTSMSQEELQELVRETHALHRATRDSARKLVQDLEPELVVNHA